MAKKIIVAFFLCMCAFSLYAEPDADTLRKGIEFHDLARIDPKTNIARGKEVLGPLRKTSPIAKAYYGSLVTLEASEYAKNKNGIKALALLAEGTGLMDEACKDAPDLFEIHFLRLVNSYEVSEGSPMNRYKAMKKDIDWIGSRLGQFDATNQGIFHLYSGFYNIKARRSEEAMASFESCIAVSPGSPEAAEAKKQLARYAE